MLFQVQLKTLNIIKSKDYFIQPQPYIHNVNNTNKWVD